MPEALRSQLKWTPTGQNTDSVSIKKDNCSGLKHIKNLQTCERIMIRKTIAGVCAVYPAMSLRRSIPRNLQTGRQLPNTVLHTFRLKIIQMPEFQALHNSNLSELYFPTSGSCRFQLQFHLYYFQRALMWQTDKIIMLF